MEPLAPLIFLLNFVVVCCSSPFLFASNSFLVFTVDSQDTSRDEQDFSAPTKAEIEDLEDDMVDSAVNVVEPKSSSTVDGPSANPNEPKMNPQLLAIAQRCFPNLQFSRARRVPPKSAKSVNKPDFDQKQWRADWEASEMKYRFEQTIKAIST